MKAVILNGSPREGNTFTQLGIIEDKLVENNVDVITVSTTDAGVSPCLACEQCSESHSCVFDDDTNEINDAVVEADIIVFGTPVYWWGISAQLKLVIDKFYAISSVLKTKPKKVGIVITGEAEQDDPQYEIIPKQFKCICDYLDWEIVFCKTYTALNPDEFSKMEGAGEELGKAAELLI